MMALVVEVTSDRKGGNPGGVCTVIGRGVYFPGYFKYCHTNSIHGSSSFRVSHQAVYEALTFKLVREFGLRTTDFYVLLNRDRNVTFTNWKRASDSSDPSGRDLYFVSKILPHQLECTEQRAAEIVLQESVYLNSLLVGDIIGCMPNYRGHIGSEHPQGVVTYIDLGCSFVYAKGGKLSLPHRLDAYNERTLKSTLRHLAHISIFSPRRRVINLADIVEKIPRLELPTLNPTGFLPAGTLLSYDEVREIQSYVSQSLMRSVSDFKTRKLVIG